MAASRPSKRKANARRIKNRLSRQNVEKAEQNPQDLIIEANTFLNNGDPEAALPLALRALNLIKTKLSLESSPSAFLPALNLLAEANVDLGETDAARNYFLQAVDLDPEGKIADEDGGGAEKFLWLAQLCEEGGEESVRWFERGATVLRRDIATEEKPGGHPERLEEKKKKLAGVLCGIIEVYMTDLSLDPSAEQTCTTLITTALTLSPNTPTPHQTYASILISQSDHPAARTALRTSLSLWTGLPPSHPDIPDFPAKISLARLLLEVSMEPEALGVLEGVVNGDEACVEGWYLGGWGQWLLAEKARESAHGEEISRLHHTTLTSPTPTAETIPAHHRAKYLKGSRRWLLTCLDMYRQVEYEDERLRDHAQEVVNAVEQELRATEIQFENDDDDDDDDDDDEEEGWERIGNEDEEGGEGTGKGGDEVMEGGN